DLFGGDVRKVVARLHLSPHAAGAESILHATLAIKDAQSGTPHSVAFALSAEATTDVAAVEQSADPAVVTKTEEVRTAETTRRAAEEFEAGNKEAAIGLITRRKAAMHKMALPAPSAAAQAGALDEVLGGLTGGKDRSESLKGGRSMARELEKK